MKRIITRDFIHAERGIPVACEHLVDEELGAVCSCAELRAKQPPGPLFLMWKFRGMDYLALRNPDGYLIVDNRGAFYGAWQYTATFRRRQRTGNGDWNRVGAVTDLAVRPSRQEGRLLQCLFEAAENHAEDFGKDYNVGHLQDLVTASWEIMSTQQQSSLLSSGAVRDLIDAGARGEFTAEDLLNDLQNCEKTYL